LHFASFVLGIIHSLSFRYWNFMQPKQLKKKLFLQFYMILMVTFMAIGIWLISQSSKCSNSCNIYSASMYWRRSLGFFIFWQVIWGLFLLIYSYKLKSAYITFHTFYRFRSNFKSRTSFLAHSLITIALVFSI
jgi:hypothetical protein